MRYRYLLLFTISFTAGCVTARDDISLLSKSDLAQEYRVLSNKLVEVSKENQVIQSDDLFDFLDRFSQFYAPLFRESKTAQWLSSLGAGNPALASQAGKNLDSLVNANADTFWKLRKNATFTTDEQRYIAELWEDIFIRDKPMPGSRGSAKIWAEILEVEETMLKSRNRDFAALIQQEKDFVKLFKLRNQFAQTKGYVNHLAFVFSEAEIAEIDRLYEAIARELPENIGSPENIGGLTAPRLDDYFAIQGDALQKMGLFIDKRKVKYFLADENLYKRTFLSIIEPKKESRIFMYFSDYKLYPDEYLQVISSLMHETGHALHFQYMNVEPFIFNFFDSTVTETAAIFFENMIYTEEWIERYFPGKLTANEVNLILKNKKKSDLEFLSYALFLWDFEKAVYQNPDQDMKELYKKMAARHHFAVSNRLKLWYDTSIFASHDLYYTHYTMAYLYAFRLSKHLENKYGPDFYAKPAVGPFLIENIFRFGRSVKRQELFKRLFGDGDWPVQDYIRYLTE